MSALSHLHEGVERVLDTLNEGWQYLKNHASGAITRFTPGQSAESGTDSGELIHRTSRWGLMAADVREDDDRVHVKLEAPGMEADDFNITVREGDMLSVRGEKRFHRQDAEGDFYVVECAYGRFDRLIPLPAAIDVDKASADYRNGVLRIELPKRERARRVKIRTVK